MDIFQTIGAALAFLLLLIHLYERRSTIRGFFLDLIGWLKEGSRMFKERRLWRRYCPICEVIVDYATVRGRHHIELPIKIKYTSRDDKFKTEIKCEYILVDIYHQSKRDKTPYRLYAPSEHYDMTLSPNDTVEREFILRKELEAPAELGSVTKCKVVDMGSARIHGVNKSVKLAPIEFNVKVKQ